MVFSGLTFLFVFLPTGMLLYYITPRKWKNFVLMAISLVFYGWGEPVYITIMIFSACFDYGNGLLIGYFLNRNQDKKARMVLIFSIIGNLSILGVFKYCGDLFSLALPIGISFYTFQTMSYTIDVYRKVVVAQRNLIDFATYVTMFPQLIAGPIVRYKTVALQLADRVHSVEKFAEGIRRFLIGLGKKVLLANLIGQLWELVLHTQADERTVLLSWLGALAFTFQIYFDFSGYSDMAIGLGKMFGFDYEENFRYPYMEKSITGFWRKWHISLSSWFKEYLYVPLGGNRKGSRRQLINIMIVWGLTGFWHGATPNFLVWGLYFGVLLILEKVFLGKILEKLPDICSHLYMMVLVMIGWMIFAIEDFHQMGTYLLGMFGFGTRFMDAAALYQLSGYGLILGICIIAATNIPVRMAASLMKRLPFAWNVILENVYLAGILVLCLGLIVGDTYNPFLYFRF